MRTITVDIDGEAKKVTAYTTRRECLEREIIPTLGYYVNDFDLEAMEDDLISNTPSGLYYVNVSPEFYFETISFYALEG